MQTFRAGSGAPTGSIRGGPEENTADGAHPGTEEGQGWPCCNSSPGSPSFPALEVFSFNVALYPRQTQGGGGGTAAETQTKVHFKMQQLPSVLRCPQSEFSSALKLAPQGQDSVINKTLK